METVLLGLLTFSDGGSGIALKYTGDDRRDSCPASAYSQVVEFSESRGQLRVGEAIHSSIMNLLRSIVTIPLCTPDRQGLARMIHEGSSRKRADARRDGHLET